MLSWTCTILPVEWEITMVAGVRRPEMTAREEATTVVIFFLSFFLSSPRRGLALWLERQKRGSLSRLVVDCTRRRLRRFKA
jgi:hypothetical protein